ncbi:MAG: HMA2 domain-containing protein [Desulfobacteria bacterium]
MNCYVHSVPGRLRVKTPTVKRNRAAARHVEGLMKQLRGVSLTTANTITGSVLVVYNPKAISADLILNTLENEGHFDNSGVVSSDQYIGEAASKAGRLIGKVVFGAFVERAFQGSALSYLAVFI